jgi:cell division protein ftsA
MRRLFTSIELSSNYIKLIILEKIQNKFYCLYSDVTDASGISKGLIIDSSEVISSLKKVLKKAYDKTNLKIDKVILTISPIDANFMVVSSTTYVDNIDGIVNQNFIDKSLNSAVDSKKDLKDELVMTIPVTFKLDDNQVLDPVGMIGNKLYVKAVASTMAKKNLYPYFNVFNTLNIDVIDICYSLVGDFEANKSKNDKLEHGVVINIEEDIVNIGIFNKGILIKTDYLKIGSSAIDKDIKYIYDLKEEDIKYLKENFASLSSRANYKYDTIELNTSNGNLIKIKESDVVKIITSRVTNILDLVKNKFKNLTNKEINYIIVTGELTELNGCSQVVEKVLGPKSKIGNIKLIGARNNIYSSVIGSIYYLENKYKNIGMLNSLEIEKINSKEYE